MSSNAIEVFKRAATSSLKWVKNNPLKISGMTGLTASGLLMYIGETSFDSHTLALAGLLGVTAYCTQTIWGKGGKKSAELSVPQAQAEKTVPMEKGLVAPSKEASRQNICNLFSLEKSLSFWRFPVESAAFQGILEGACYFIAGALPFVFGDSSVGNTSLALSGLFCMGGGAIANCVPEIEGKVSPLAKAALLYSLSTVGLAVTAIATGSLPLSAVVGLFAISEVSMALSHRHDNKAIAANVAATKQAEKLIP